MKATLTIVDGPSRGAEVLIDQWPITIGRSYEADLTIDDRWVSRHHVELRGGDQQVVLRDLGSRHGTLVNGEPALEATLGDGARINLGITTLVINYDAVETGSEERGTSSGERVAGSG